MDIEMDNPSRPHPEVEALGKIVEEFSALIHGE